MRSSRASWSSRIGVWFTSAASQADLDGDGHVDLIVGNYNPDGSHVLDAAAPGIEEMMHSMSRAYNGGMDRLLLWEGRESGREPDARFREAGEALDRDVAGAGRSRSARPTSTATCCPRSTSSRISVPTGCCTTARNRGFPGSPRFRAGGRSRRRDR